MANLSKPFPNAISWPMLRVWDAIGVPTAGAMRRVKRVLVDIRRLPFWPVLYKMDVNPAWPRFLIPLLLEFNSISSRDEMCDAMPPRVGFGKNNASQKAVQAAATKTGTIPQQHRQQEMKRPFLTIFKRRMVNLDWPGLVGESVWHTRMLPDMPPLCDSFWTFKIYIGFGSSLGNARQRG
jgi:hypothetical protein